MGSFHKDMATWMVTASEDPDVSNQQIVKVRLLVLAASLVWYRFV
jgi:hypothetical protein